MLAGAHFTVRSNSCHAPCHAALCRHACLDRPAASCRAAIDSSGCDHCSDTLCHKGRTDAPTPTPMLSTATHLVFSIKGVLPSTALVQPYTKGPDVTLLVVWLVLAHLWREVIRSANHGPCMQRFVTQHLHIAAQVSGVPGSMKATACLPAWWAAMACCKMLLVVMLMASNQECWWLPIGHCL